MEGRLLVCTAPTPLPPAGSGRTGQLRNLHLSDFRLCRQTCMCWVWRGPPSPLAFQRLLGSRRYSVLCGCLIHGCGSTITNRQSHVLLCSTASLPPSPMTWLPGTLAHPLSSWIHSLVPSGPDELCCLPRVSLCQCLYIPARVRIRL